MKRERKAAITDKMRLDFLTRAAKKWADDGRVLEVFSGGQILRGYTGHPSPRKAIDYAIRSTRRGGRKA